MHVLYKIANKINGKFYIGVHKGPMYHYWGSGKALKGAISKYGRANFKRTIIGVFTSANNAYMREAVIVNAAFIARSDTYNMSLGGCRGPSRKGISLSIEHRRKLSLARLGLPLSAEHKAALRNAKLGVKRGPQSAEHRRRLSEAHIGKPHSKATPEHRRKISVAITAHWAKRKQKEVTP